MLLFLQKYLYIYVILILKQCKWVFFMSINCRNKIICIKIIILEGLWHQSLKPPNNIHFNNISFPHEGKQVFQTEASFLGELRIFCSYCVFLLFLDALGL